MIEEPRVTESPLADPDLLGYYDPDSHLIVLRKGLCDADRRCTEEHERLHAELGHRGDLVDVYGFDPFVVEQQEERANRRAARRLIAFADLMRMRLLYPDDPSQAADELGVNLETLETRVRWLSRHEKDELNRAIYERGEVA